MRLLRPTSYTLGKKAENRACKYLIKNSYNIIKQNYKTAFGEIDIIAEIEDILVAIEVKYRSDLEALPFSISRKQQNRIQNALLLFQETYTQYKSYGLRFDAIFVDEKGFIRHIDNAWWEI